MASIATVEQGSGRATSAVLPGSLNVAPIGSLLGGEYLTFRIEQEEFAMDILAVQEIRSYETPTSVPKTGTHILGLVSLRGAVVPFIDLRQYLDYMAGRFDDRSAVIVINMHGRIFGVVVDSVSNVLTLDASEIRPTPRLGTPEKTRHILGIASVATDGVQRTLLLTDINALISQCGSGVDGAAWIGSDGAFGQ